MNIQFSEIESSLTKLRIGRCNADGIDTDALRNEIFGQRYDLCRVKVPAEDEMASSKLARMGLPFFFSGSIRRYSTRMDGPVKAYLNPSLEFVRYDGSQDTLLMALLTQTWGTYPIGYYRSPITEHLVGKEVEMECVFRYYDLHNGKRGWPDNSIMLMVDKGVMVGFFALNVIAGNLESHIGGIPSRFQNKGYFLDMLTYIRKFCLDNGLPRFLFGARNENARVQRIFEQVGFSSIGNDNVFHIPAMLSFSQSAPEQSKVPISATGAQRQVTVNGMLQAASMKYGERIHGGEFSQSTFQATHSPWPLYQSEAVMTLSGPVVTDAELLVVCTLSDTDGRLLSTGHLWCRM